MLNVSFEKTSDQLPLLDMFWVRIPYRSLSHPTYPCILALRCKSKMVADNPNRRYIEIAQGCTWILDILSVRPNHHRSHPTSIKLENFIIIESRSAAPFIQKSMYLSIASPPQRDAFIRMRTRKMRRRAIGHAGYTIRAQYEIVWAGAHLVSIWSQQT